MTKKTTPIVLREKQKEARIDKGRHAALKLTKFDSCVNCAGKRVDFVVRDDQHRSVFIELKGRHIEDCAAQIVNSFNYMKNEGVEISKLSALVVCSKVPLGVSSVQKLAASLRSAGIMKLKVKTSVWSGRFDDLF